MKNKYLVANPFGVFLIRCETKTQVSKFIIKHLEQCQDAYYILTQMHMNAEDYMVRDLEEVPIYEGARLI